MICSNTPNKKAVARKSSATGWSSGWNQLHHSPVEMKAQEPAGPADVRVCVFDADGQHTHTGHMGLTRIEGMY